jgi:hypothetical protein
MQDGIVAPEMKLSYTYDYLQCKLYGDMIYAAICTIITVIILGWSWMYYPLAFIISEFLYVVLYLIISCAWKFIYWERLSTSNKLYFISENHSIISSWYPETNLMSDLKYEARNNLVELKEYYSDLLKIEEREKDTETDNLEIIAFKEELSIFKNHLSLLNNEDSVFLDSLIDKLNKIIELLVEKPANSIFANKIFNIYLPEIIILLKKIPKDEVQKVDYLKNVMNVLKEIDILSKNTIETIIDFNQKDTEITFDVLMKDIKKAGEDLNERRNG